MLALRRLLDRMMRTGRLRVIDAGGGVSVHGDGDPAVTIRLHDRAIEWRLLFDPELALGEGFTDGRITVEDASLYDLLDLVASNLAWNHMSGAARLAAVARRWSRRLAQFNPVHRSHRNVAHHYDLSGELYRLFLDKDRQYSCAYFMRPDDTIEAAQAQKKRHIAAKLLLRPGQRVLDIGSGWGGLALTLAGFEALDVTGLTLSQEQHRAAAGRAAAAGLADRVRFKLLDYRQETGRYDRIVSVGMFEHVGVNHYDEYFGRIAELLTDDGVALVHSIGRADGPGATNPWIRKYIFPGGYSPALSEVLPSIERAGLYVTDIEILRLHYAETLRAWRDRFNAERDRIRAIYDERFCRMWEFYLAGSEVTFRYGGHIVFQVQLARKVDTVPLTRDYITAFEAAHPLPGDAPTRAGTARATATK